MALSEEDKKKALQVWGMDKSGGGYTGSLTEEQRQNALDIWGFSDLQMSATAQRAAKNAVGVAGNVAGKLKRTFGAAEEKLPRPSQIKMQRPSQIKMPRPFNSGLYDQLGSYLSEKQKEEDAFLKYQSQMVGNEQFTVKDVGGVEKLIPQYSGETYSYLSKFYRGQEEEYRKLIDQQQESYNEKKQQWDMNKGQNEDNMALWLLQKQQDGDPHALLYTSWQDYLEAMWDGSIPEEQIPEDAKQYLDEWDIYEDYLGSGKLQYYENTANQFGDKATMYQDMSVLADMPEDVFEAFRTYAAGPMTDISIGLSTPMYHTANQMAQEGTKQYEEARDTVTKYLLSQGHPQGTAQYLMESWKRHEDEIQAVRDARQAEQEVENSKSGGVVQFAKARGAGFIGGLEQASYAASLGLAELLGVDTQDERYHYQNTNADAYRMSMYAEAIDAIQTKKASEIGPEWVGSALATLRGATGSMVDNGIRIAIGYLSGAPGMSLGLMGMSSYGSGYREAAERGATVEQATAFGAASAMLEIVTEKVSLENLLADKSALTLGQKLRDIFIKQPLLEISEEEASFIGGKIADALIMGNQSENNLRVGELMADGKTWEEAKKEVLKENLAEMLQTAFETYLSAGMMSGATYTARGVGTKIRRKTSGIDFAEEGYKHFGKVADLQDLDEQRASLENRNKGNEEALEEIDQEYESARGKLEFKALEDVYDSYEEEKQAEEDARNERQASVEAIAEELGPYYKDSFIANYDGETDPEEYRSAYMEYAVWGKISQYQGQDRDTALRDTRGTAGYATQVLSKEAQEEAFDIGRIWARDDQARTTQVQKQLSQEVRQQTGQFTDTMGVLENAPEVKQRLEIFSNATGMNIGVVDEDTGFNGSFVASTMSMVLNARYNDNLVQTLGHELMEFVSAFNRNDAQKLRKSLAKWWVNQEGAASVDELVKRYQRSYEKAEGSKTYSQAMDELVNDAIGALLTTEDGLRKLVEWTENRKQVSPNEQKNILGRAKEFLQKIVDGIKRYLQGKDIPEHLKRFLHMETNRVENLMDQFLKGVETATERARSTGVYVEDSEVKEATPPKTGANETTDGEAPSGENTSQENKEHYSIPILDDDLSMFGEEAEPDPEREKREERLRIAQENFAAGAEAREEYRKLAEKTDEDVREVQNAVTILSTIQEREEVNSAIQEASSAAEDIIRTAWNADWKTAANAMETTQIRKDETISDNIDKECARLKARYRYAGEAEDLKQDLTNVWKAVLAGDYAKAFEAAKGAALKAVTKGKPVGPHLYSQHFYIRDYLKNNAITISEDDANQLSVFYRDRIWRESVRDGRMKYKVVGADEDTNIDQVYKAFAVRAPELIAEVPGMTRAEKLESIWDAVDEIYKTRNMTSYAEYGAIQEAANKEAVKIVRRVAVNAAFQGWGLTKDEKSQVIKQVKDLRHKSYEAEVRADEGMKKLRKKAQEVREQRYQRVRELEEQRRQERIRGKEQEKAGPDMGAEVQATREQLEALKAKLEQADKRAATEMRMVNKRMEAALYHEEEKMAQAEAKLQRMDARFQEFREKRYDLERKTELWKSAYKERRELVSAIIKPTDKNHIPERIKKPLGEFLLSLDVFSKSYHDGKGMTKGDIRFKNALAALKEAITPSKEEAQDDDTVRVIDGYTLDLTREALDNLDYIFKNVDAVITSLVDIQEAEKQKGRQFYLKNMEVGELKILVDFLHVINTAVKKANTLVSTGRSVVQVAEQTIKEANEVGSGGNIEPLNKLRWELMTPTAAMERMGGKPVLEGFQKGQGKLARNLLKVNKFSSEVMKRKETLKWENAILEYKTEEGKVVKMTPFVLMDFYNITNQPDGKAHMLGGGFHVDKIKRRGKRSIVQEDTFLLTEKDIEGIREMLEKVPRQMEVAGDLQKFCAKEGARMGNEVSMERHGYIKYGDPKYWPIRTVKTDHDIKAENAEKAKLYYTVNPSFTKPRQEGADKAIVVGDVRDTFTDHMRKMLNHNAYAIPILDAMKWLNKQTVTKYENGQLRTESVRGALEKAYGEGAEAYIVRLIQDINAESTDNGALSNFASKAIGRAKSSAVGASIRVALLQGTAYDKAGLYLPERDMQKAKLMFRGAQAGSVKNLVTERHFYNKETEDMLEHCDTALWKSMGFFDNSIGPGLDKLIRGDKKWTDVLKELSMKRAEKGDSDTWTKIWIACKLWAAREMELEYNDKQTKKMASKKFDEIIYATQVMDSLFTKSQLARRKDVFSKTIAAFGNEPATALNIIWNAESEYGKAYRKARNAGLSRNKAMGEAWMKTRRLITRTLFYMTKTFVKAAIVESLVDAWRDDDDYEDFLEKFLQALVGEYDPDIKMRKFWEGNLFQDVMFFMSAPWLKDMISIAQGYENSRMDTAAARYGMEAVDAYNEYQQNQELGKSGGITQYGVIYRGLRFASAFTGMPMANAVREAVDLYNHTIGVLEGNKVTKYERSDETKIKEAYLGRTLSREEAEREITGKLGKTANEAYWMINQWETGMKKTDLLDLAVLEQDGELIEAELERLMSHTDGLKNEGDRKQQQEAYMRAAILRTYKDGLLDQKDRYKLYDGKSLTRDQAAEMLQEWTGMSETEILDALTKKEYEAKNGAAEGYSPFNALFEAMKNGEDLKPYYTALIAEGYEQKELEEKAIRQVQIWYRDLDLSWEEAAEMLEKNFGITDKKELYKFFTKADYEMAYGNTKGYSEYENLHNIVGAGGDISSEIRYLTDNGYTEKEVRDEAVKEVKRLFVGKDLAEGEKKLSLTEAQRYLEKYGRVDEHGILRELDEDEVYWKLEEWKYYEENRNNENVKPWSKFLRLYQAVEDGAGLGDAISYYRKADIDKDDLGKQVEGHFKDIYMELLNTDPNKAEILALHIIDALDSLGLSKYKAKKVVKGWEEEAEEEKK